MQSRMQMQSPSKTIPLNFRTKYRVSFMHKAMHCFSVSFFYLSVPREVSIGIRPCDDGITNLVQHDKVHGYKLVQAYKNFCVVQEALVGMWDVGILQ
jgi:hypothetical protein